MTPGEYDIMLWSGFDVEKEEEVEKLAQYSKDHKAVEMSFTQVTRGIAQCHIDGRWLRRRHGALQSAHLRRTGLSPPA